ncbi:hypothetical protein NG54_13640 [Heyndrickxia ginsengihumi]|uniref:Ger(X)C family spore germination protein n=1 Tax=Heyndrickxia ginsengihumi TaxID=363870 RepID=A0A0A6V9E0_9BACI|nr:hypothetical protein NG54_13640 [Heyndrickxia ginsengihumi]
MFIPSMLLLSGCWDSEELNDRAIEVAWGIDETKDKKIQISTQVVIPSKISGELTNGGGGGSQGNPYFVATGIGKNTLDAVQQMQIKLSRKIFRGQQRVIVIGEALAKKGIRDILDNYTRDPSINLLTDVFVVKGNTAKNFLKISYPMENIPAVGALKEYNQIGSLKEGEFLNFLLSTSSQGSYPTMPVISIESPSSLKEGENREEQSKAKGFRISGIGIFNKNLKLVGFLNMKEGRVFHWLTGNLDFLMVTSRVPKEKGYFTLDLNKLDSNIEPIIQNNKVKILVTLTGQGNIRENNTRLDLTKIQNISIVQNSLDKEVEKTVLQTITKVQKKYGTDIFGFSNAIKRKDMRQWKSLKKNWDKEFSKAEISVKANLIVRKIGVTGPSIIE